MNTLLTNLKSLASDRRLMIIKHLQQQERTVNELAKLLHISQPGVSYHLRRLYREQYVYSQKIGKYVRYSLSKRLKDKPILGKIKI